MYDYSILPKAYGEFFDAWEWYSEIQDSLGERFKQAVFACIRNITRNPYHFPAKQDPYRETMISVFPYLIVYQVFPDKHKVAIISIFHCKRNPTRKIGAFSSGP